MIIWLSIQLTLKATYLAWSLEGSCASVSFHMQHRCNLGIGLFLLHTTKKGGYCVYVNVFSAPEEPNVVQVVGFNPVSRHELLYTYFAEAQK